jgi:hypothetical protein
MPDAGTKHIVYTTFTSDGACLPPVIFVGKQPPAGDDGEWHLSSDGLNYAYVIYIEGLTQASTRTTEVYLETIFNRWENGPVDGSVFIMDVAPWHVSAEARALWDDYGLVPKFLPATTGKWLNPCDQSIHREMRRTFSKLQQRRPKNKLKNIIDAYYAVTDKIAMSSFKHTHLLAGDHVEHLRNEAARGFRAGPKNAEELERARLIYEKWVKKTVRRPQDVFRPFTPEALEGDSLDGVHWAQYGRKKK